MTDKIQTILPSSPETGSELSDLQNQKERKNQRKKDIYILLGQVTSLLEEIKERVDSLGQDIPSLGGCGGTFLKRKAVARKAQPAISEDECHEVIDKWMALGRNPRDYTHGEIRTFNSIRKRLTEHGKNKVFRAIERIHACTETTFLPYLSNAFGQMNKLAPYYADDWEAPAEPNPCQGPEPKMYIVPDRQEGDIW